MNPFLGEIAIFAFNKIPQGWLPCNGQVLPVNQYAALFSLLQNTYPGGDGKTTFALPDLRGRVAVNQGLTTATASYKLGLSGGTESVALTSAAIPAHTHSLQAVNLAPEHNNPTGRMFSQAKFNLYATGASASQSLNGGSIAPTGGSVPHENRQPSLALCFCIATVGLYPTRP